jgi:hypothetical protein
MFLNYFLVIQFHKLYLLYHLSFPYFLTYFCEPSPTVTIISHIALLSVPGSVNPYDLLVVPGEAEACSYSHSGARLAV